MPPSGARDRGHRGQAQLDDRRCVVGKAGYDEREQGSQAGGRARLGQTAAPSGRRFGHGRYLSLRAEGRSEPLPAAPGMQTCGANLEASRAELPRRKRRAQTFRGSAPWRCDGVRCELRTRFAGLSLAKYRGPPPRISIRQGRTQMIAPELQYVTFRMSKVSSNRIPKFTLFYVALFFALHSLVLSRHH